MTYHLVWALMSCMLSAWSAEASFNNIPYVPVFSPEETIDQWKDMEKKLIDAGESITKQVMPMLLKSSSELDLSPECQADILKVVLALRSFKMWAVKMVDANGRPQAGMVSGTLSSHGAYDQCLDIEVKNQYDPRQVQFRGQYCSVDFRPPLPQKPEKLFRGLLSPLDNITFKTEFMEFFASQAYNYYHIAMRMGTCSPSTCTRDDVQQIIEYLAVSLGQHATVVHCEVKEVKRLDSVQLAIIIVLGVFGVAVSVATLADNLGSFYVTLGERKSGLWRLVDCFSATACNRRLFKASASDDPTLTCLNGVRFFSITWVVLVHTYLFPDPVMYRNGLEAHEVSASFPMQVVHNASLVVDSFFFMTGVLMAYHLIKIVDQKGSGFINFPVLLLRRIWRLLPSAMLAVGLMILLPLTGSGPTWYEEVELDAQACRRYWWYILLFINNFKAPFSACLMHTWYISVDMQLLILAIVFFLIFFRSPKLAISLSGIIIVGCVISSGFVTWYLDLFPVLMETTPDKAGNEIFVMNTYILPYPHLGSYFLGILLGIFLARKKNFSIPVLVQVFGWPLAIACNCAVIFATWPWNSGRRPTQLESWTYAAFNRTAWGVGMTWMTLMCATGRAGVLNEFLSWSGFTILNRLSYLVYLLHYLVISYYLGNLRGIIDAHQPYVVWLYFSNVMASFMVAYVFRVLVEGPLVEIERMFFNWLQQRSSRKGTQSGVQNELDKVDLKSNGGKIQQENGFLKFKEQDIIEVNNGTSAVSSHDKTLLEGVVLQNYSRL